MLIEKVTLDGTKNFEKKCQKTRRRGKKHHFIEKSYIPKKIIIFKFVGYRNLFINSHDLMVTNLHMLRNPLN